MNQATKTDYHPEDVADGDVVNVLTSNKTYYNKISAGICIENGLICILLAEDKKQSICVPFCEIKEIEIIS